MRILFFSSIIKNMYTLRVNKLFHHIRYLSLFGIVLAVYLLWEQLAPTPFQPCNINATVNCDAVIKGPVAYTLGIRTPLYGLTGFIIMLIASYQQWRKVIWGVATFGVLFCVRLMFIEIVQLQVLCPVCVMCQLVMLAVWVKSTQLLTIRPVQMS